jgi:hypothetical protein
MKLNISLSIALAVSLLASACVTVPQAPKVKQNQLAISSVRDMPISYAAGSLFSLAPKYVEQTSLKPEQTQNIYKLYADAIISDLSNHGFKNTLKSNDSVFHVGFEVALTSDLSDQKLSEEFGVAPGLPSNENLKKASFIIYVEDARTTEKVWRGAVQGFAHEDINEAEREQRVAAIVSRVLKQFYATN